MISMEGQGARATTSMPSTAQDGLLALARAEIRWLPMKPDDPVMAMVFVALIFEDTKAGNQSRSE